MSLSETLFEELKSVDDSVTLIQELDHHLQQASEAQSLYQSLIALAERFGKSGYVEFKITILNELWAVKPTLEVASILSQSLYDLAHYEISIEWNLKAQAFEQTSNLKLLHAKALFELERLSEAKSLFQSLIKDDPTFVEAYYYLGQLAINLGDHRQAQKYFDVIIEYFPENTYAILSRKERLMLMITQEVIKSEEIDALLSHEDLPMIQEAEEYLYASKAYFIAKQYDKALEMARVGFELDHDGVDFIYIQHQIADIQSNKNQVMATFEWLVKNLPPMDELYTELVPTALKWQIESSPFNQQLEDIIYLVEDLDTQFELLKYITFYYSMTKAVEAFEQFLDQFALEISEPGHLSYAYAKLFELQNNFEEAEAYYMDAIELALNIDTLYDELIQLYLDHQETELAFQLLLDVEEHVTNPYLIEKVKNEMRDLKDDQS